MTCVFIAQCFYRELQSKIPCCCKIEFPDIATKPLQHSLKPLALVVDKVNPEKPGGDKK